MIHHWIQIKHIIIFTTTQWWNTLNTYSTNKVFVYFNHFLTVIRFKSSCYIFLADFRNTRYIRYCYHDNLYPKNIFRVNRLGHKGLILNDVNRKYKCWYLLIMLLVTWHNFVCKLKYFPYIEHLFLPSRNLIWPVSKVLNSVKFLCSVVFFLYVCIISIM